MKTTAHSGPRTPLTVIGGFLGAGKTTLLNRILREARGPTAVLVNDFGAVNVDAGLIAAHDGKTLRLTNGCVCCSLADGFLDTMMRVLAEPFDHVVVEASGVGDPWAIAEIALVEPSLVLSGVIVLADAERIPALLADARLADTIVRQIRAADIVVLNKIDLVDAAQRDEARALLAAVNPSVRIVEAVQADMALDLINVGDAPLRSLFTADAAHETRFHRILYRRQGSFDRDALSAALDSIPPALLRLKGTLEIVGEPIPQLLQMSGARWSLSVSTRADRFEWPIELVGIACEPVEGAVVRSLDSALRI